jgi:putative transposase
MSEYRRFYREGSIIFLTIVTYNRQLIFKDEKNIDLLRKATAIVKSEMPFEILGAVILPNHLHFLWQLPPNNGDFSKRVGRLKALFTKSFKQENNVIQEVSRSRIKHRESNIWQRRFWDHHIRDEEDFEQHLNYIHYNPVKHHFVSCPHFWQYSSFNLWVKKGVYSSQWACICDQNKAKIPDFSSINHNFGE